MKDEKKYPMLEKLANTPDDELRDDDHLNRKPLLTESEALQAGKELTEKYKDRNILKGK